MLLYNHTSNQNIRSILQDHEKIKIYRSRKKEWWYDNIFTFDIETTSLYRTPTGKVMTYDYSKSEDFYSQCEKFGIMYVWQFGIDDLVIYGRTWDDFRQFIKIFDEIFDGEKIIYVHNLSFEFQFLQNVFQFEKVFARQKRKVLVADVGHLHFRCSYFLVNMSLEKWAKQRKLTTQKSGDLDYNLLRTPETPLFDFELDYCERDILVMYEGLKEYRAEYGHIFKIPLTQTGEIRLECQRIMKPEYNWRIRQAELMPKNLSDYLYKMSCFFGGDVHANYIHADRIQHGVTSYDFASSYPWVMLSELYPQTPFRDIKSCYDLYIRNPRYSYIVEFEAVKIECKLFNTWLSHSRCLQTYNVVKDNGRIISADYVRCIMTNIDYEMFLDFYEYAEIKILRFQTSINKPINKTLCRYILDLYKKKTEYRGLREYYDTYMKSKQKLNSIYGDQVTRDFTDEILYDRGSWDVAKTTEETYLKEYEKKQKRLDKLYKSINIGIWVTAYARRNLWRGIIAPLDEQIVYFDTDSGKFLGNGQAVVSSYNMMIYRKHYEVAERIGVPVTDLSPIQPNGKGCPIGVLDYEGTYEDFKALHAKCYALKNSDGEIEITIAGVPKKCAANLKSVDDLTGDLVFTPDICGKNISHYMDDQPGLDIFGYRCVDRFGICLQPTGYQVNMTADYMLLLIANREKYNHDFDFMERKGTENENGSN